MSFTNEEILRIAMEQSAADANCHADDFRSKDNVVVISKENKDARKYLQLPFACHLISYGNNIVASVQEKYRDVVSAYIHKYPTEHC